VVGLAARDEGIVPQAVSFVPHRTIHVSACAEAQTNARPNLVNTATVTMPAPFAVHWLATAQNDVTCGLREMYK
jgi:hypothetical protein